MIFSKRDYNMVMIMIAVLLIGLTYLLGDPMFRQWRETATVRDRLDENRAMVQRSLNTRGELEEKLVSLRATLPKYGMNEAVGASLLQQVRRLADENRVITTRITPDAEKNIGDLYEQSIECTWEAELEPLVRFLYARAGGRGDARYPHNDGDAFAEQHAQRQHENIFCLQTGRSERGGRDGRAAGAGTVMRKWM
jgi:hypothetical protein